MDEFPDFLVAVLIISVLLAMLAIGIIMLII